MKGVTSPQRVTNNTATTKTLQQRSSTLLDRVGRPVLDIVNWAVRKAPSEGWRQGLRRAHSAPSAEERSERGTALSHDVGLEKLRGPLALLAAGGKQLLTVTVSAAENEERVCALRRV